MEKFEHPSTSRAATIVAHALIDVCGGSERLVRVVMELALAAYPHKPTKTSKRRP